MKIMSAALLTGAFCLLAGCAGPAYYAQAAAGHLELMRQRQEVTTVLADEETGEELRRQLQLASNIRQFAVERLRLPDNGSYLHFVETGREAVAWNVVAAPEFSLQPRRWCFPIAGCVPYLGYFDPADARRLAARLEKDGYDVAVSPALAYSTLGWFRDPLLDTMFRYSEEQLAAVIFHEFAHQKLYVKGDTAFSESYATFIEDLGVTLWLQSSGRTHRLPDWRRRKQAAAEFAALLDRAREQLNRVYSSAKSPAEKGRSKAAVFRALEEGYPAAEDTPTAGQREYAGWFDPPPNNATLALFDSYQGGACAFAELYEDAGRDLSRFQELAAERALLDEAARRAWLDQPCEAVAPSPDL